MARLATTLWTAAALLGGLAATSACMASEEFTIPSRSALDFDRNGKVDHREVKKYARELVDARIKQVLEAGGEELTLPEADKCVSLAGWLSARAEALDGQLKRFSRLDADRNRVLVGKEYDSARELARLMSYCGRKVDRTGDGAIDRFEFMASRGTRAPRPKVKRRKGETAPIVEAPKSIKPYDANGDMSLSFGETTGLAVHFVARKNALASQAAELRAIAVRLGTYREAGEAKLTVLVEAKKRKERAEDLKRLKAIVGSPK